MRSHTIPMMTLAIGILCAPVASRAGENLRPVRIDVEPGALAAGTFGAKAGPAFAVGAGYALTDSFEVGSHVQTAADVRLFDRSVGYTCLPGNRRPLAPDHRRVRQRGLPDDDGDGRLPLRFVSSETE